MCYIYCWIMLHSYHCHALYFAMCTLEQDARNLNAVSMQDMYMCWKKHYSNVSCHKEMEKDGITLAVLHMKAAKNAAAFMSHSTSIVPEN